MFGAKTATIAVAKSRPQAALTAPVAVGDVYFSNTRYVRVGTSRIQR